MLSVAELRRLAQAPIHHPCIIYGAGDTLTQALSTVPHLEIDAVFDGTANVGVAPVTLLTGFDEAVEAIFQRYPADGEDTELNRLELAHREVALRRLCAPFIERRRTVLIPRAMDCRPLSEFLTNRMLHIDVEMAEMRRVVTPSSVEATGLHPA